MKDQLQSALNRVKADEALVNQTQKRLRRALGPEQAASTTSTTGRIYQMKKFAIAACLALLLIGGGFAYATPVAYLSVDINPSVELGVNGIGHVVSLEGLNQDGTDVLAECRDIKGMKVREAVHEIVDVAADLGYLKQGAVVSLTAITDDEEEGDKLTKDAKEGTDEALDENDTEEVEVVEDSMTNERAIAARAAGISPGKMNLLRKLWEAQNGEAYNGDFTDLADMVNENIDGEDSTYAEGSVQDIMKAIKEIKKDAKLDAGTDEETVDNDSDTEDNDEVVDKVKGNSANAPGQLLKNQTITDDNDDNDDDQDTIKPDKEKKPKKNVPGEEE